MRVLVASNHLEYIGGTETFTYAITEELLKRNHTVEYFTFEHGLVSEKLESLGVSFFSGGMFDLILASHCTTVESLHPHGFTIQTCHGIFPELEKPSSNADAFVAISHEVQQHLAMQGLPSVVIHNGVNCDRFAPSTAIAERLGTVLSLCQSAEANRLVAEACQLNDLELKVVGERAKRIWNVEELITQVDLVIGLGRSAYDALACGRPVIVFDMRDYSGPFADGYLPHNLGVSLMNNCSGRFFKRAYSPLDLANEMKRYRWQDGEIARNYALRLFNVSIQVDKYLEFARHATRRQSTSYHLSRVRRHMMRKLRSAISSKEQNAP